MYLPFGVPSTRLEQGSTPEPPDELDVGDTSSVGNASGVSVGNEVGVGVSVGGNSVAVGMAAWVSATMVNAAATAVL